MFLPFHQQPALRIFPDSSLRLPGRELDVIDSSTKRLVELMLKVMTATNGIGIAAPQVGVAQRVCLIAPAESPVLALINPRVQSLGQERVNEWEACLSLPGVSVEVSRPDALTLTAHDLDGEEQLYELSGPAARIVQHELDHLDGRLIIDYADWQTRAQALRGNEPRPSLLEV